MTDHERVTRASRATRKPPGRGREGTQKMVTAECTPSDTWHYWFAGPTALIGSYFKSVLGLGAGLLVMGSWLGSACADCTKVCPSFATGATGNWFCA